VGGGQGAVPVPRQCMAVFCSNGHLRPSWPNHPPGTVPSSAGWPQKIALVCALAAFTVRATVRFHARGRSIRVLGCRLTSIPACYRPETADPQCETWLPRLECWAAPGA